MKHTFLHKFETLYMHFIELPSIRFPYAQRTDITDATIMRQHIDFWWELDGNLVTQEWDEGILIINLERR